MTSSMENRPSDSVVWACRLPFSADIGEMPAAGPQETGGASAGATARAGRSVTPRGPKGGGASLVLFSYPGGVHAVKDEEESSGAAYPVLVKSFLSMPNLGLAFRLFLSRMGNSMGEMPGEATKYGGPVAPQPDVKWASACVSSRSAVGFVMISTAPSSRARSVSWVSA